MTSQVGITPEFQKGTCSICKGHGLDVRIIAEQNGSRVAAVCKNCAANLTLSVGEVLQKYGKRMERKPKPHKKGMPDKRRD